MREIYFLSNILGKPFSNILNLYLNNAEVKYLNTIDVPLSINNAYPKYNEFILISDKLSDKEINELTDMVHQKNSKLILYIINVDDNRDLTNLTNNKNVYLINTENKEKQIQELVKIINN